MNLEVPAEHTTASALLQPSPITLNLAPVTSLPMPPETASEAPTPTRTRTTSKLAPSGKKRTFTATVSTSSGKTPSGTVMFKNGPKVFWAEAPLDRGTTTIKVEADEVNGVITATYSGDSRHAASSDELVLIPSTAKAEPAAPMAIEVPHDVDGKHTSPEVPNRTSPSASNPSGKVSSKASRGTAMSPRMRAAMKRVSRKLADDEARKLARRARKIADDEARKQARRAAALSRKHVASPVAAHDDNVAAPPSIDTVNAPSAAAKLGAGDAAQPGVSSAHDGGSLIDEHPEEAALELRIVTLLQERQASKNTVQESKKDVARLQEELDRAFYDYKQELAKPGRNGGWTPFLRDLHMSRATADRWANRHDLRVNPKPSIGSDEAISGPTEKDVNALMKKVLRLTQVLTTPDSIAQFLRCVTAVLQPPTSAA